MMSRHYSLWNKCRQTTLILERFRSKELGRLGEQGKYSLVTGRLLLLFNLAVDDFGLGPR
jgi:hypothetical protein